MNPQGEHARLIFDALTAAGVRDVVVSPGSRSTPLVQAAAANATLRCHHVIDERAAAFYAVGRAKVTGVPVALVCTSGSAPAHYLPAMVEASAAHVPLVVLSADRPLSLQACGASQTIDQVKLFGDQVRWYADLGLPGASADDFRAVRRACLQAVFRARHPVPGPVHLNARADKPLEPAASRDARERELEAIARAVGAEPCLDARPPLLSPDPAAVESIVAQLRTARSGMIVAGPAPLARRAEADVVTELARRTGFALLAEATSQVRFTGPSRESVTTLDAFDLVLGSSAADALRPDVIVQLGAAPVSARFDAWLRRVGPMPRVVVAPHGWPDPQGTATLLVQADVRATLEALVARLDPEPPAGAFREQIGALDRAAWAAVRDVLRECGEGSEGAMTRAVVETLPEGALLAVGNSLPVRHLDDFCPGQVADVRVWSQRGAAGIDGNVAGAAGAADASGVPTVLLLGDVALLHDLGSLEIARRTRTPLAIVVLNNDGGRIFEQLPVARAASTAPEIARWTTPHGLSFEHSAALFGHRYARVDHGSALASCVAEALSVEGCTLIEATVPPHGAAELAETLRQRVDAAIAEVSS